MKKILFILPVIVLFSCGNKIDKEQIAKDVKQCFENYKSSILKMDGKESLKFVDNNTINYYDEMLQLSLKANKEKVEKLGLMDRIMVLSLRHRIEAVQLKNMTGRSLFIYAVNNGMIGETSVKGLEIGKVGSNGNTAKAEIVVRGKKAPFFFYFNMENEEWKLDLTQLMPNSEKAMVNMIAGLGIDENEYIFQTLGLLTGEEPNETIWEPIMK